MSKVVLRFSMSLDGFVAGPRTDDEHPLGVEGTRLHAWMEDAGPVEQAETADAMQQVGAVVVGRRTFDIGLQFWNDTPYPAPSFVVTHRSRPPLPARSAS